MTPASTELDRLFEAATKADVHERTREELSRRLYALHGEPLLRTHDWRNHLPRSVLELWDSLPLEARLVAFILASSQAKAEIWR